MIVLGDAERPYVDDAAMDEWGEFMRSKRIMLGLVVSITAILGSVLAAPTASAATLHGCPDTYFCFYFNSGFAGARGDYFYSDGNLDNELFNKGGANGRGVQVKNNAASVVNNWLPTAVVYYNSGCNGTVDSQSFGSYASANFKASMKNNNASFRWPGSTGAFSDCANRDQF